MTPELQVYVYRASSTIRGAAVLTGIITGFMGYNLWQTGSIINAFFFLLTLGLTVAIGAAGQASLTLTGDRLIYRIPAWHTRVIELRQLVEVEEAMHHSRALLLHFHPLDEHGRVNRSEVRVLGLLPLNDQHKLQGQLEAILAAGR